MLPPHSLQLGVQVPCTNPTIPWPNKTLLVQANDSSNDQNSHTDSSSPQNKQYGMLAWMLRPCHPQQFIREHLDCCPLHISRPKHQQYFDNLLTKADIQQLLKTQQLQYGLNIDVTRYSNGKRCNLNYSKREDPNNIHDVASAATVMKRFRKEGCSVRILHPQRWIEPIYRLLSLLEDELRSPVGCNAYLTPPDSQGFAPHWDDIDAFILQVEGSKRWCLYAPQDDADLLPLDSSRDFREDELGQLLLDVVLHPGDLLYMPRGCIHHAEALQGSHSLHLTVSANQHCSWSDLFEVAVPRALQLASSECIDLRRSLPFHLCSHMGLAHEESESDSRHAFQRTAQQLGQQLVAQMPWDAAADRMAIRFIQQRLPPYGLEEQDVSQDIEIVDTSKVYLAKAGIAAMAIEDDAVVLYHCLNNARLLHAAAPEVGGDDEAEEQMAHDNSRLEFELDFGIILEHIVCSSPRNKLSVGELSALLEESGSSADINELLETLYSSSLIIVQS